ncbi:hypothetical protein ACWGTI_22910 [Mesorhizobium sp. ArgA1]
MRFLLITFASLSLSSAFAFDGGAAIKDYDHARPACRQGEMNGQPISETESAKQYDILAKLGKELSDNGYCWNATEQEWAVCK